MALNIVRACTVGFPEFMATFLSVSMIGKHNYISPSDSGDRSGSVRADEVEVPKYISKISK
jgi:hypothetical protein